MLKSHLRDNLLDELENLGSIHVQSASPYDQFNYIVKQAYDGNSTCLQSITADTFQNLCSILWRHEDVHVSPASINYCATASPFELIEYGEKLNLHNFFSLQHSLEPLQMDLNVFHSKL